MQEGNQDLSFPHQVHFVYAEFLVKLWLFHLEDQVCTSKNLFCTTEGCACLFVSLITKKGP